MKLLSTSDFKQPSVRICIRCSCWVSGPNPPSCRMRGGRKYDRPLYCAAWPSPSGDRSIDQQDADLLVMGGGGGNGIPNTLLLARYDFQNNELTEAVYSLSTGEDVPYRMAVHPGGDEIVCSCSNDCRLFNLHTGDGDMKLEPSDREHPQLLGVGDQFLIFSPDGSRLAAGGKDGHLRVFEWPSLEPTLDKPGAHKSIKDLDFSLDGAFLASTGDNSPCRIWDLSKAASITPFDGDKVVFVKFSRDATKPLLYAAMREGNKNVSSSIAIWDTSSWTKLKVTKLSGDGITAFAISRDGKNLAIGMAEGDVIIVDTGKMDVLQRVKKVHLVFVTSLAFSPSGRALLSVSADSSAYVTILVNSSRKDSRRIALFIIFFLASLLLYLVIGGFLPPLKEHIFDTKRN